MTCVRACVCDFWLLSVQLIPSPKEQKLFEQGKVVSLLELDQESNQFTNSRYVCCSVLQCVAVLGVELIRQLQVCMFASVRVCLCIAVRAMTNHSKTLDAFTSMVYKRAKSWRCASPKRNFASFCTRRPLKNMKMLLRSDRHTYIQTQTPKDYNVLVCVLVCMCTCVRVFVRARGRVRVCV